MSSPSWRSAAKLRMSSHIADEMQAELNQSKDAGNQLRDLTSTMTDIQDTLGGGLVSWLRHLDLLKLTRSAASSPERLCRSLDPTSIPLGVR